MAILNPWTTANKQGIPRIETKSVNVSTSSVSFSVDPYHTYVQNWNGLVAFKISQAIASGTTGTLPVLINNQPVVTYGGVALTAADIKVGTYTGILVCWWDSSTNTLQLLNGL